MAYFFLSFLHSFLDWNFCDENLGKNIGDGGFLVEGSVGYSGKERQENNSNGRKPKTLEIPQFCDSCI